MYFTMEDGEIDVCLVLFDLRFESRVRLRFKAFAVQEGRVLYVSEWGCIDSLYLIWCELSSSLTI